MATMRLCFLLFCLSLASVSSLRRLQNFDDLKNSGYANRFPRHGLRLLFWFAQNVNFDQNNNMELNFFPDQGAFGFHYFGNRPSLLPSLSSRQRYYSVGNLNTRTYSQARALPSYVRELYRNRNLPEENMDRLIVSLDQNQPNRISRVFVTAHNRGRNDFNPSETYEIDPALLSQIRQTSLTEFLRQIQDTGYCQVFMPRTKRSLDYQCDAVKLQIKTTTKGYSKLKWTNIPDNIFETFNVYIEICQNAYSSDTSDYSRQAIEQSFRINKSNGSLETSVLMNAGLQPRLRLDKFNSDEFRYGPEVDGGPLVRVKGFDASLQLCAANGKACARLYIKKTFSNWKSDLYYSWVGFFRLSHDKSENYDTYQYVVNFAMIDKAATEDYDIYQYDSSLTIAPGVQLHFLLDKNYDKVLAQTAPWERDEEETEAWSFPEFFYEPEFYDANNVVPIKIDVYDAGLQLFTKDGKACARLYIKKTFKNWKDVFYYSWVGFYTSSQNQNHYYDTYQYATEFEKKVGDNQNFDIYQYKSKLTIAPGVQIRFLMDNGYDKLLAETEPWKSG